MRKKILVAIIVIFLILIGCGVWIVFNADKLIAKLKPQIESLASEALGVGVSIGNIDGTLLPSTRLRLANLKLSETNSKISDSATDSLNLKEVILDVELMSALTGNIKILKLSVNGPKLILQKEANKIQVIGFPSNKNIASSSDKARNNKSQPNNNQLNISLDKFEVIDGSILLRGFFESKEISLTNLNLSTSLTINSGDLNIPKYSLETKIQEKLHLAILGEDLKFNLNSEILDAPLNSIKIKDNIINTSANFDLKNSFGSLNLTSPAGINFSNFLEKGSILFDFIPAEVGNILGGGVCIPNLKIAIDKSKPHILGTLQLVDFNSIVNSYNIKKISGSLSIDANLENQKLDSDSLNMELNGEPLQVSFSANHHDGQLIANPIQVNGFGGTLKASTTLKFNQPSIFTFNPQATNLQIERVLSAIQPGAVPPMKGLLTKFASNLSGPLSKDLIQKASGNITFQLENGSLEGLNFASSVLHSIKQLPMVSGALTERVPENKKILIDSPNTEIKLATGTFQINNGALETNNLIAKNSIFDLNAAGIIKFDTTIKLNATFSFLPEFSKALAESIKELRKMFDINERLTFPITIQGQLPNIVIIPDLKKILELGAERLIKDKASQFLEKTFKDKSGADIKGLGDVLGF